MRRALILAVSLGAAAAPAEPVGLVKLLEAAERNNVDLRLSFEQREQAEAEYRAAWTALFPSVSANGAWTHNQFETAIDLPAAIVGGDGTDARGRQVVIVPREQLDATLRVDLPLIDPARWVRSVGASILAQGAATRVGLTRDQVRRQVILSWYRYAGALRLRDAAQKSVGVAQEQRRLQQARADVGAVTELDLLRARAEVERNLQTVADVENLVATSRRAVTTLTFVDPGDLAALPPPDLSPAPPIEQLQLQARLLPAVRAAELNAQAGQWAVIAQQVALVPAVGAQFVERLTNATGFSGRAAQYGAGLNFSWRLDVPLFAQMSVAHHQRASAELALERAVLQARDQIHTDWQQQSAALTKVAAATAQAQAAQRAAEVARVRHEVGVATQIELIQAERDLFSAEVNQIQAQTELASAQASLRISAGLPLELEQ